MSQSGRIGPLMAAALFLCASVGCSQANKKQPPPAEPAPVMATEAEQRAIVKAQRPISHGGEVDLAEDVALARDRYRQSLESLLAFYRQYGYFEKSNWAEKEIQSLRIIPRYPYMGDPTAGSTRYEASETNTRADALYAEARKLHDEGTGLSGLLGGGKAKLGKALDTYRMLIDQYPTSDKIDEAAFYAGEIYASDSQKEYTLALNYYQRCLDWNPNTDLPVRMRMAYVYDYPLRNREKAMALYKEIIEKSTNRANVRFAQERIRVLTDRASHEAPDVEPGVQR